MTEQTIEIHFRHPRDSKTLIADLSPFCTGQEAIQALQTAEDGEPPFLTYTAGEMYQLCVAKTNQVITPNMTFAQAGVANGDLVDVIKDMTGAHTIDGAFA